MSGLVEMLHTEKELLRRTCTRIRKLFPGPAGRILASDLDSWADFGYRYDKDGDMAKLVTEAWNTLLPDETELPDPVWTRIS
jgi:hypothetical protein